jgi:hypothetical protein
VSLSPPSISAYGNPGPQTTPLRLPDIPELVPYVSIID